MSKLKLSADSGGGTVALVGPASTTSNANVELKLPVADGSNGQALTTNGSGQLAFSAVSGGAALTGSTNNTVCTVTGANAIQGESNVQIDSNGRVLIGTTTEGAATGDELTIATDGSTGITIRSATDGEGNIFFSDGTSGGDEYRGMVRYEHSNNALVFKTDTGERLRIDSSGNVKIAASGADAVRELRIDGTNGSSEIQGFILENDGGNGRVNLKYGTGGGTPSTKVSMLAGGGLTFNGDTAVANALQDYEEGTFTPGIANGFHSGVTFHTASGLYVKIGSHVLATFYMHLDDADTNNALIQIGSLPYTSSNATHSGASLSPGGGNLTYHNLVANDSAHSASCYMSRNTNYVSLYRDGGGENFRGANNQAQDGKWIVGYVNYFTDA